MTDRLRRLLLAFAVTFGVVMLPTVVAADTGVHVATVVDEEDPEPPAATDNPVALNSETDTDLVNLSPIYVTMILGSLIPLVNGLVTKLTTSTKVKVVIGIFLSAVAGLVTVSITPGGGAVIGEQALIAAALTFATTVVTYLGFYKPLELTSSPVTRTHADGTVEVVPGKLANVGVK